MLSLQKSQDLSTKEGRRSAFSNCLESSVLAVIEAAKILHLMEESGDPLDGISPQTISVLRRIHTGKILPPVATELSGVLKGSVMSLPIPQQQQVLDGLPVRLLVLSSGAPEVLSVDPRNLEPAQVKQVFGPGCIRSEAEQRIYLEDRLSRKAKPAEEDGTGIEVNRKRGIVVVKGVVLTKDDLLTFLKQLG